MRALIGIGGMVIMGIVAHAKGFSPWLWILAGGIPGFIILLCMPSATAEGLDEATREERRTTGNTTGAIISVIAVLVIIGIIAYISSL